MSTSGDESQSYNTEFSQMKNYAAYLKRKVSNDDSEDYKHSQLGQHRAKDCSTPPGSMVHLGPNQEASMPNNTDLWSLRQHSIRPVHKVEDDPDLMDAEASLSQMDYSSDLTALKKKRGVGVAGKSIEEELCLICGDRASGYHYNALSCEGCKGFFRRSITRNASYNCKSGGNCEMDMWMRRRCQSCRLRRCKEVGMKEECLLSDEQCRARDIRRKARVGKIGKSQSGTEDSQQSPDSNFTDSQKSTEPEESKECIGPVDNPLDYVSREHREIIELLVINQDKFEVAKDEDIQKISEVKISNSNCPADLSHAVYKHMAEMTILVTQLVVEFAKHLPGFPTLDKEDQILLLKGCACEVMTLRTSRRYDLETDTVIFGNGVPFSRDTMKLGGLQSWVDTMFSFCRKMAILGVDNAEYSLITAICIFSERPGLFNAKKVEQVQEVYIHALEEYIKYRRQKGSNFFAKILMKLVDLRTLSVEHSDVLFALKVEKGSLPPLLGEYFDIME